jgi:hypothetical protein
MGQLTIRMNGSFKPNNTVQFSAMQHGHAAAVMEAIQWLQQSALPEAIRHDLQLQAQGFFPEAGFNVVLSDRERACPNCDQLADQAHSGEHPCPICGLAMTWDDDSQSTNPQAPAPSSAG